MTKYVPDYYKILRIRTTANKETIKKAYEVLSKQYIQEFDKTSRSKKMYKLVNDAYVVLSDDEKRRKYDKIREEALQNRKSKRNVKKGNVIDLAGDVKDSYDLISKLFNFGSKAMKGKGLISSTNLIIGGAMAGYGVKKGRDYVVKRREEINNRK